MSVVRPEDFGTVGASMHLKSDMQATPGSTLKLLHTGSYWAEVSRSIN